MRTRIVAKLLTLSVLLACLANNSWAQEQARAQTSENKQSGPRIETVNVLFRYSPELAVLIVRLRGTLIPTEGHPVVTFNDPHRSASALRRRRFASPRASFRL